jgi:hypothetical protein
MASKRELTVTAPSAPVHKKSCDDQPDKDAYEQAPSAESTGCCHRAEGSATQRLLQLLCAQGGRVDAIQVQEVSPSDRRIVTVGSVKDGAVLVSLPLSSVVIVPPLFDAPDSLLVVSTEEAGEWWNRPAPPVWDSLNGTHHDVGLENRRRLLRQHIQQCLQHADERPASAVAVLEPTPTPASATATGVPDLQDAGVTPSVRARLRDFLRQDLQMGHACCLWLELLVARQEPLHPWHSFCETLPRDAPQPLSWPAESRRLLAGTNLGAATEKLRASLHEVFDHIIVPVVRSSPTAFAGLGWNSSSGGSSSGSGSSGSSSRSGGGGGDYDGVSSRRSCNSSSGGSATTGGGSVDSSAAAAAFSFSFDAFLWARGVQVSRSFPPQLCGAPWTTVGCMLPLLDMMNHPHPASAAANNTTFDTTSDVTRLLLRATQHLPAGAEVCYNYGEKSNEQFMFSYGFCLRKNPHNAVTISATAQRPVPPPTDEAPLREHKYLVHAQRYLLGQLGLVHDIEEVVGQALAGVDGTTGNGDGGDGGAGGVGGGSGSGSGHGGDEGGGGGGGVPGFGGGHSSPASPQGTAGVSQVLLKCSVGPFLLGLSRGVDEPSVYKLLSALALLQADADDFLVDVADEERTLCWVAEHASRFPLPPPASTPGSSPALAGWEAGLHVVSPTIDDVQTLRSLIACEAGKYQAALDGLVGATVTVDASHASLSRTYLEENLIVLAEACEALDALDDDDADNSDSQ